MAGQTRPPFTIDELESGTLDVDAFDHEAHIYIAWLYLEKYSLLTAIERLTSALRRLTTALGVADKYHETMSWFFMIVVAERRDETGGKEWHTFYDQNGDLFADSKNFLSRYYSENMLYSDKARRMFILPTQGEATI